MSMMTPDFVLPEDIENPWEIRSKTSYGATGMMRQIASAQRGAAMRQQSMRSLLRALNQMHPPRFAPPVNKFGGGPGPSKRGGGPRKAHRRGGMKGIPRGRKLDALAHAIGVQESGGGYGAYNASSGASGKYQILKGNFVGPGGWDREALGRDISYRRYMNTPRLQEKIARSKLKKYIKAYGLRGAAQAWYGGPGAVGNDYISGGAGYPTTGGYADSVMGMVRRYLRRHR